MAGLVLTLASAGFSLRPVPAAQQCSAARHAAPVCSGSISRRATLGLLGVGLGAKLGATPAHAGYVTSLGIVTTKPEDVEIDDDLIGTSKVQKGLKSLYQYKSSAAALSSQFNANTDMALIPAIRKGFDLSDVRDALNVVSTVLDDQAQLTIDRISRSIIYDLTELENASRFKKGEEQVRTPKKIANVQKWFTKLDVDFKDYLSYFPAPRAAPPPPPPPPPEPESPPAPPAAE